MEAKRALILPGHGGKDSGAIGNSIDNGNQMYESKMNLNVSLKLKGYLESNGVIVDISRKTDIYISPSDQLKMANRIKYDVVIAVHHNAGGGDGWEVVHNNNKESERLADLIGVQFQSLNNGHGKNPTFVSGRSLALQKCKYPTVYTEFCFVDTKDMSVADTLTEQYKEANAIAYGVLQFLGLK